MRSELEAAMIEYAEALKEKTDAQRSEVKARVRSTKAYHRLVLAKRELRALELEAQEPIYAGN